MLAGAARDCGAGAVRDCDGAGAARAHAQMADLERRNTALELRVAVLESRTKRTPRPRPYWTKSEHPELPMNVFHLNNKFRWKKMREGRVVQSRGGFASLAEAQDALCVFLTTGTDISTRPAR